MLAFFVGDRFSSLEYQAIMPETSGIDSGQWAGSLGKSREQKTNLPYINESMVAVGYTTRYFV